MDAFCDRLQRNDPTLTTLTWPSKSSHSLEKLGRSLAGNTSLKQLTFHRMNLTETAARDLAAGIRLSALQELTFERTKLQEQPKAHGRIQKILREGIRASVTVQRLSLVDMAHTQSIEFVLSCAPNLRELSLRGVTLSNRTAKSITNCISRSYVTLQTLHIEKLVPRGCTDRRGFLDWRENVEILCAGMRSLPLMERLEMCDIPFDLRFLDAALTGVLSLRELTLKRCVLSRTTTRSLARSVRRSQLQKMHLENLVPLTPMDSYQLWNILRKGISSVQTIRQLELWDVKGPFGGWENVVAGLDVLRVYKSDWARYGIIQLADALLSNTSLTSLTLQDSCVTSFLLLPILLALSCGSKTLQKLDLSDNIAIGYDGLKSIGLAIKIQPHLTAVHLTRCASDTARRYRPRIFYSDRFLDWDEQEIERTQAEEALLDATHQNPAIEILNVRNNHFSDGVMATIHFHTMLRCMRRYLRTERTPLADTIWCQILAKCQSQNAENAASLIFFALSEQPTLLRREQVCVASKRHES